jgi:anti-sigma regulatory factor (Ser/Thr protein kinase)
VDLTVPASSDHLRVLRLVTSSLAASLGFDIDQLDDLRVAVDELCSLLIEHASPDGRICLTLRDDRGHLFVEGSMVDSAPGDAVLDPVSQLILDGLDIDWSIEAPAPSFCLVAPSRQHRDGP